MERELAHWVERLRERAEAEGLSFPPVAFQEVGPEEMAMLAAYGGFPRRYPHWRWGSAYLHYRETYRYGLARIYELVVNTVPVQAYLLRGNPSSPRSSSSPMSTPTPTSSRTTSPSSPSPRTCSRRWPTTPPTWSGPWSGTGRGAWRSS